MARAFGLEGDAWQRHARVVRDGWMTVLGVAVQMAGKIWFLDRMALLYHDVTAGDPAGPGLAP